MDLPLHGYFRLGVLDFRATVNHTNGQIGCQGMYSKRAVELQVSKASKGVMTPASSAQSGEELDSPLDSADRSI